LKDIVPTLLIILTSRIIAAVRWVYIKILSAVNLSAWAEPLVRTWYQIE
jgi:hypothetical protein